MVFVLSTIVYLAFGVLVLQIISKASGYTPVNPFMKKVVSQYESDSIPTQLEKRDLYQVFFYAFLFRVLLLVASAIAVRIFMTDSESLTFSTFLDHIRQWDAKNYIGIAEKGYANHLENGKPIFLVFFPVYSWLMRGLSYIIPSYEVCGIIISIICYCFGCCYLYAMVAGDYSKGVAKKSVIYLSIFPFAFHFGGIMTESVFFLTSVASLYHIRKHQWLRMMIWGAVCALSRMHGLLLLIAAGVEMCEVYQPLRLLREEQGKEFLGFLRTKAIYLLGIPVGTLIYLYINYAITGNPFMFTKYQKEIWYQGSTWFTNTLTYVVENALTASPMGMVRASIWIPELTIFILALGTIVYGLKRHSNTYLSYLFVYLILNYSLTWVISGGRYMSVCIPMFIIWAEYADRHETADRVITIVSALFMGIYLTGFLFTRQII
ncbi:membrane spanning protein [Lachnospiraceae bacterium KM106-2]|nr:membrane spanning protein [Lachnospiraceae bacterium KM106-2]